MVVVFEMPSGMRRSTRVFGLVKGVDGARVLRSGRMLWPNSGDGKLRKGNDRDDWLKSVVDSDGGIGCNQGDKGFVSGSTDDESKPNRDVQDMVSSGEVGLASKVEVWSDERDWKCRNYGSVDDGYKMFSVVYVRTRKGKGDDGVDSDGKRYGKSYYRKNKRQKKDITDGVVPRHEGITVVIEKGSSCFSNVLSNLLFAVLNYMKMVDVRLSALIMFVMSEPLQGVFLSQGVQFSQGSSLGLGAGFCKIIGSQEHCPIFSVDFSASPACFMLMHCQILLRYLFVPLVFVHISSTGQTVSSSVVLMQLEGFEDMESCPVGERDTSPKIDIHVSGVVLDLPISSLKQETRYSLRRHVTSRSIRKRRSSLRARRGKSHSFSGMSKCNGTLASDLVSAKKNGFPFSSVVSGKKIRGAVRTRSTGNPDEKSSKLPSLQDSEPISCTANFLNLQSDQCLPEEGVNIVLDVSNSGECFLVGKKDGLTRFMYKPFEAMKPCFANNLSHSAVWSGDNGWKLEFPDSDDWLKFKDLHKECVERNKQVASPRSSFTKIIPVPQVCEVLGYEEDRYAAFRRPDSYIISKGDELSRAMTSMGSCYDMDSEDEEWLKIYNNSNSKLLQEGKLNELVSDETFEHMIDKFEKDFYCNPHDLSDEKEKYISCSCTEIANKDVLEAVYGYWSKKRKHRRSALVKVFQGYQPRKTPLVPKPVFRKRRSFKRQASHQGRGKPPAFLQAVVTGRDATEEQAAIHKFEEAQEFADRSIEFAINKRQRAQSLTENADLATYRAAMALRIAGAAQVTESPDIAASHYLD